MTKATTATGSLQILQKFFIATPFGTIYLNILPEISDSKAANYPTENVIGRSSPVINYAYSEPRNISMELHFLIAQCSDILTNLTYLRLIESCVYPGDFSDGAPYTPPPVCSIQAGRLLGDQPVCAVLKNYNVKFPTDVPWDAATYLPYKFSVSTSWECVYSCATLPSNVLIQQVNYNWLCPANPNDG